MSGECGFCGRKHERCAGHKKRTDTGELMRKPCNARTLHGERFCRMHYFLEYGRHRPGDKWQRKIDEEWERARPAFTPENATPDV